MWSEIEGLAAWIQGGVFQRQILVSFDYFRAGCRCIKKFLLQFDPQLDVRIYKDRFHRRLNYCASWPLLHFDSDSVLVGFKRPG